MNIFPVILSAAMVFAVLHMVAPDHWIPLTLVSKKFNYSSSKTYETALLIGILHSASSVVLAVVAYYLGELLVRDSLYFLYLSSVILLIIVGIYFIFNGYFEGQLLNLPLDIRGTDFQKRVWSALRTIPYGEVRTYQQVAEMINMPKAHRAVANACASNPVPLIVPCHRVVRKDGGIGGYALGVWRKKILLQREKENL